MGVTVGDFSYVVVVAIGRLLFFVMLGRHVGSRLLDVHVQAGLLSTSDMESYEAVGLVALYAGADVALAAYVAKELPTSGFDILDANHRLEEDGVCEMHFGYPNGADHVGPFVGLIGLLECAEVLLIRTQAAFDALRRALYALSAQPLAFGYVRYAVAFLVHSQIAHVTEEYCIAVDAFAV
jgi:hypothetical protein